MEVLLNRKIFIYISLLVLSTIVFLVIKLTNDKIELTKNITLSATSLTTVNEIVNQIKNENEENSQNKSSNSSSNKGNNNNKPNLKEDINNAKDKLSKQDFKKVNSEYEQMTEQMTEHIKKLEQYKLDPYKFDNKGFLKNAPNEQVRQNIINGRIEHLESEIKTFYDNIVKTLSKIQ